MTGFPDDRPGGPPEVPDDGPGSVTGGGDGGTDPLEALLRPPTAFLHAPPGAFEQIRRKAVRRRRTRAAVGSMATVAAIAGTFYLVGSLGTGNDEVVGPPASSPRTTTAPTTQGATGTPSPPPTTTGSPEGHPTPTSATPTATADPSAGGVSTPTAGSTTPIPTPMCTATQLTAALGGGDAGAGNLYRYLVFTNTGGTTCHLTGFPGVSMVDASGRQIGQPATRQQLGYASVVLKPGASASDTIHTVNQQGTCLPTSTRLRLYPPGNTAALLIPGQVTDCYNTFSVTPLLAGKDGNPSNAQPTAAPTTSSTGSSGGSTAAPTATPTPAPTTSGAGQQVTAVPSGAPDTGMAEGSGGGGDHGAIATASAAGVLAAAALGTAVVRRRRTQARG